MPLSAVRPSLSLSLAQCLLSFTLCPLCPSLSLSLSLSLSFSFTFFLSFILSTQRMITVTERDREKEKENERKGHRDKTTNVWWCCAINEPVQPHSCIYRGASRYSDPRCRWTFITVTDAQLYATVAAISRIVCKINANEDPRGFSF